MNEETQSIYDRLEVTKSELQEAYDNFIEEIDRAIAVPENLMSSRLPRASGSVDEDEYLQEIFNNHQPNLQQRQQEERQRRRQREDPVPEGWQNRVSDYFYDIHSEISSGEPEVCNLGSTIRLDSEDPVLMTKEEHEKLCSALLNKPEQEETKDELELTDEQRENMPKTSLDLLEF
jgi:hypothetical protein